jgi:predicted nucleic acid-binding Zn ribbon protein
MQKKVSAAAFRLKGGGWYETDFKSGSKKNVAESGKSADKGKSESKTKKASGNSSNSQKNKT